MKKVLTFAAVMGFASLFMACGPSEEEKRISDSTNAAIYKAADSLAKTLQQEPTGDSASTSVNDSLK